MSDVAMTERDGTRYCGLCEREVTSAQTETTSAYVDSAGHWQPEQTVTRLEPCGDRYVRILTNVGITWPEF